MSYEVTPVGTITGFVAIEKPSTKFNEDGTYSCQVAFTGDAAREMKERIDGYMQASKLTSKGKKMAAAPYTIEDKTLIVKFKNKAIIKKRTGETINLTVRVYDAKNKECTEPLGIGEGSKVKVAYQPYLWNVASLGAGCSLQLSMVQILELKKASFAGGGSPFGEEDGFTAGPKASPFEEGDSTTDLHEAMAEDNNGDF